MVDLHVLHNTMYRDVVRLLLTLCSVTSLSRAVSLNVVTVPDNDLTCWTCPNKTDNEACNDWAPDVNCPLNFTWCMSIHRLDVNRGKSLVVHKKCALPSACTKEAIGCRDSDEPGIQECVSCCNVAYCNEVIPYNHSAAVQLSTIMIPSSANHPSPHNLILGILIAFLVILTQCYHSDGLVTIVTELESLLLTVVAVATACFYVATDRSLLLWQWIQQSVNGLRLSTLYDFSVALGNKSTNSCVSEKVTRIQSGHFTNKSRRTNLVSLMDAHQKCCEVTNTGDQHMGVS